MLHIEYQLTEKEFLDYSFYTGWQMPGKKATRIRYYITWPVLYVIVIIALLYLMDRGNLKTSSIIIAGAGLIFILLVMKFRIRSVFDNHARKIIEQSGTDTILSKTELSFNEKEIFGKTDVAEVKYSWNAFKEKVLINNCCYLYTNVREAIVIPLRAFTSSQEKEQFEKILLAHFPLQAELANLSK